MADRPDEIPTKRVKNMRDKGMSNDQIVQTLQRDGYRSSQIFDAMTQADMEPAREVEEVTDDFPDIMENVQGGEESPQQPPSQGPSQQPPQSPPQQGPPGGFQGTAGGVADSEAIEELVESIIDEKWQELEENVKKVVTWKNETEKQINQLENDIEDLSERFDKLHQAVIGKVGEYDKNIMNVGAEIKAMEKAFSKIIPEFADSVTELTELVEELKEDKKDKE